MMEGFSSFIIENKDLAHWFIFFSALLAGLNVPISIDLLLIGGAFLASNVIPDQTIKIFSFTLAGCVMAAWIAYFLGRLLGPKVTKLPLIRSAVTEERVEKVRVFYERYGLWTFMVGRFIPFGVRNCIFMSSGLSKVPFKKFALYDLLACTIWATSAFTIFYFTCKNYTLLISHLKTFNIIIFSLFAVTLISVIWYKKRKNRK